MLARALGALVAACGAALAFAPVATPKIVCGNTGTLPPCSADVSISVSPPSGNVYVGEDVVFTVTVTNAGPVQSRGLVSLTATPAHMRLSGSAVPKGCVSTCQFAFTVQAGSNMAAQFHLRPRAPGTVTLQASSDQDHLSMSDPNLSNNAGSATVNAVIGRCTSGVPTSDGNDRIFGTIGGEVVNALAGDDLIRTGDGDDCVNGGPGNDTIAGGNGDDLLRGGAGADTISGGPGKDKISGDAGNDTINAADGERDVVNCGPGRDKIKADKIDSLRHCERVRFAR